MNVIKVAGTSRTSAVAGAIAGVFRENSPQLRPRVRWSRLKGHKAEVRVLSDYQYAKSSVELVWGGMKQPSGPVQQAGGTNK